MAETTKAVRKLGRWLSVSNRVGSVLTYWVLTQACQVLNRSTIQHVTVEDRLNSEIEAQINEFNKDVDTRLDDTGFVIANLFGNPSLLQDEGKLYEDQTAYGVGTNTPTDDEYRMEQQPPEQLEENDVESEAYDKLIGEEFMVDFGCEGRKRATVKKRARDYDGNLIGTGHCDPQLDQREYVIEYEDGTADRMFGNIIAANLHAQLDEEGKTHVLLKEIVGHRKTKDAIEKQNGYTMEQYGAMIPKRTTRGWELCVKWRNGDTTWVPLKDLKDMNPVNPHSYGGYQR
jgi:hypothetical protein